MGMGWEWGLGGPTGERKAGSPQRSAQCPRNGPESEERAQQVVCYRTGAWIWRKVGRGEELQFAYPLLWLAWLVCSPEILK